MHSTNSKSTPTVCLALAALVLAVAVVTPATAQEDLIPGESLMVGVIPGTRMTRDEFRARAQAQLTSVALNAEVYRLVYARYPESFSQLQSSVAWNLDIVNMFTGSLAGGIYYQPQPSDMIPEGDLLSSINPEAPIMPPPSSGGSEGGGNAGNGGQEGEGEGSGGPIVLNNTITMPLEYRVDPGKVDNITPGDIFLYSTEDTLQLLMYAPDLTFQELFNNAPNRFWQSRLQVDGGVQRWPDDLFAAQLLYYAEDLLPQSYNHVMFMSDRETLPAGLFKTLSAENRLLMAHELGIVLLNPFQERAIEVMQMYSAGDFFEPDPSVPVPMIFCLTDNRILTRSQLIEQQTVAAEKGQNKSRSSGTKRPSRPPLGGSR